MPVTTTQKPDASPASVSLPGQKSFRRSKSLSHPFTSSIPTTAGVLVAVAILLVSAGATIFFLTKAPDDQRLYEQGQRELTNGQYAFAVKTLTQASALRPKDAKVFLALARAYVGVDQIDKAWDAISQAQQLGAGVIAEPPLASDLANYYRQRGHYEKAIELIRPLAKADISGKKAELANLDALWGDEALRDGKVEEALRCWEEVRELKEGSRYAEAESRLATIYQKLANTLASQNNNAKALSYLSKLNTIAQNARTYQMTAEIYEKDGQLELAIDHLRKAIKLDSNNALLNRKLASLLSQRGKELLDSGNTDSGYAYLQQAKETDPQSSLPDVTLQSLKVRLEGSLPRLTGEIWNPGPKAINSLSMKVELWDTMNSRVLWNKEQKVVDEFVPPLLNRESKSFEFIASCPVKSNGRTEFRVFFDGRLYKSYPIGKKEKIKVEPVAESGKTAVSTEIKTPQENTTITTGTREDSPDSIEMKVVKPHETSLSRPPVVSEPKAISPVVPIPGATQAPTSRPGSTAEEKTMKELEY